MSNDCLRAILNKPDAEILLFCDVESDGTSTTFLRHFLRTPSGVITQDTTLNGITPYVVVGTASVCNNCALLDVEELCLQVPEQPWIVLNDWATGPFGGAVIKTVQHPGTLETRDIIASAIGQTLVVGEIGSGGPLAAKIPLGDGINANTVNVSISGDFSGHVGFDLYQLDNDAVNMTISNLTLGVPDVLPPPISDIGGGVLENSNPSADIVNNLSYTNTEVIAALPSPLGFDYSRSGDTVGLNFDWTLYTGTSEKWKKLVFCDGTIRYLNSLGQQFTELPEGFVIVGCPCCFTEKLFDCCTSKGYVEVGSIFNPEQELTVQFGDITANGAAQPGPHSTYCDDVLDDIEVDWGDGNIQSIGTDLTAIPSHVYSDAGVYTITITFYYSTGIPIIIRYVVGVGIGGLFSVITYQNPGEVVFEVTLGGYCFYRRFASDGTFTDVDSDGNPYIPDYGGQCSCGTNGIISIENRETCLYANYTKICPVGENIHQTFSGVNDDISISGLKSVTVVKTNGAGTVEIVTSDSNSFVLTNLGESITLTASIGDNDGKLWSFPEIDVDGIDGGQWKWIGVK